MTESWNDIFLKILILVVAPDDDEIRSESSSTCLAFLNTSAGLRDDHALCGAYPFPIPHASARATSGCRYCSGAPATHDVF
jgi:hypothetical protein